MRLNDICAMCVSFLIKKSAIKIGLQAGFSGVSRSTHKVVTDCFTPPPPQKKHKNLIPTRHEFPIKPPACIFVARNQHATFEKVQ